MKTIPYNHLKIEIDDTFIETAKMEIFIYQKSGYFTKRNYDFHRFPILNFLDKSHFKYVYNLRKEAFKRKSINPMDLIENRIEEIKNIIKRNIVSNLIKEKQYKIIAYNIEFYNMSDIIHLFNSADQQNKKIIITELKKQTELHPLVADLLNTFLKQAA